jgi:hypothetical protein
MQAFIMTRCRPLTAALIIGGLFTIFDASSAMLAAAAASGTPHARATVQSPATEAARRYADAISKGDRLNFWQLDFACQYRFVTALPPPRKTAPEADDSSYETCWKGMTAGHAPALKRTDVGMDVLWPSAGPLVFYGDELSDTPASAFVMDAIGTSPPGSGLQLTVTNSRRIPDGSFRLKPSGKVIGVPTTLVAITVTYQDPLTAPVTYAPGTVQWTSTVKRPRRAIKSVVTQWVVFTGLKRHGFLNDTAVFHRPVDTTPEAPGMVAEQIPFTTEISRALPESLVWWGPNDQPGTFTAAAARAASFPDLRDRIALLNRILIIDPNQVDALQVLTKHLYAVLLGDAAKGHSLTVKDPALSFTVNEFYWNIYAGAARLDLSNGMEMGGLPQPTPADFLYRMVPALETLAKIRPEQLDNRFRLGMAYRWNNDQLPMIETFEALVRDIPDNRKTPKAEALLQLAWSRINKVAWNRILHDPDSLQAYADAEKASGLAELPIDKFLAEYTMAYSMIFMPDYGDKAKMLRHLTDAKRWFDEVPGKDDAVWRYFLHSELLKAVLDADPTFQPILASTEKRNG